MFSFSIWDFLDTKTIAIGILALSTGLFYYEMQDIKKDYEILQLKNLHLESEIDDAINALNEQNKAIDDLALSLDKVDFSNDENIKKLETISNEKNATCESELKSYKELFNVLGSAK